MPLFFIIYVCYSWKNSFTCPRMMPISLVLDSTLAQPTWGVMKSFLLSVMRSRGLSGLFGSVQSTS